MKKIFIVIFIYLISILYNDLIGSNIITYYSDEKPGVFSRLYIDKNMIKDKYMISNIDKYNNGYIKNDKGNCKVVKEVDSIDCLIINMANICKKSSNIDYCKDLKLDYLFTNSLDFIENRECTSDPARYYRTELCNIFDNLKIHFKNKNFDTIYNQLAFLIHSETTEFIYTDKMSEMRVYITADDILNYKNLKLNHLYKYIAIIPAYANREAFYSINFSSYDAPVVFIIAFEREKNSFLYRIADVQLKDSAWSSVYDMREPWYDDR
jgi:hypothetical protein